MSAPICDSKILFSYVVSMNANIRIETDYVHITDGCETRKFDGGTDKYVVDVVMVGTGKKKSKSISIYRRLPICPISKLPITSDVGFEFKQGYISNKYTMMRFQNQYSDLPVGYYFNIYKNYYVMIKIKHICDIELDILQFFISKTNYDVAETICKKYVDLMSKECKNHKFISKQTIDITKLYHKEAIRSMLISGNLEICATKPNTIDICTARNRLVVMTTESYNHIYENGTRSDLTTFFKSCDDMLKFKQRLIDKFL